MIDKILLKLFGALDNLSELMGKLFAPRCKCKNKNPKRTYEKAKDHGTDISFENEVKK